MAGGGRCNERKNMTPSGSRVSFTDGFVLNRNFVFVASFLVDHADSDHTRMFTFKDGHWSKYFDLQFTVRSLCGVDQPKTQMYCVGIDGRISVRQGGGPVEEIITDAGTGKGKYGYLHKIRQIGAHLYICGVAGQIYRREESGWVHVDKGVLNSKGDAPADLYSIDGAGEDDIYAVGEHGMIWHFDGRIWTRMEPVTGKRLNSVRCTSSGEVYVCGGGGGVFRRRNGAWESLSLPKEEVREFWQVEVFNGEVYLAGDNQLFRIENGKITAVDTGLKLPPDPVRLHANDGVLWSFGEKYVHFFDGGNWTYLQHPDNPEWSS